MVSVMAQLMALLLVRLWVSVLEVMSVIAMVHQCNPGLLAQRRMLVADLEKMWAQSLAQVKANATERMWE
jgi:hypothetical protein